jgi:mono/diheme cytochrome c family protein
MSVRSWNILLTIAVIIHGMTLINHEARSQETSATVDPDHAAKRTQGLALFKTQVRTILKQKCVSCHGEDSTEGKLDLATQEGLLKGGERGPAAVIGRGTKSLLSRVITHQQEPHMPKDGEKLEPQEIAAIVQWIDLGAPYDEPLVARKVETTHWTERKIAADAKSLWSYQPLRRVIPPELRDGFEPPSREEWNGSAVDRLVGTRLSDAKIHPNETVGRAALVRRVFFDVIGLPPAAEDVQQFVAESRPDAYERLVDQLLANPHYGERWGRRWLDLARFAESHGFEHDYDRASAFHYRDFVVQALNAGMPYDQFVRWQIAGDEIAPHDRLAMMATGYLAAGVHSTQITKNEVEKHRYDEMDDMLGTIGTSLLGLTLGCARCHDHKFDAIPQADYYRLLSTFTTTIRSEVELDFDPEGFQRAKVEFDQEHIPFEQAVQSYEAETLPQRFVEWQTTRNKANEDFVWLIPEGIKYQSQGNAVFTRQPDASWLLSGPSPANDVWTITFETKLRDIRSIRLEALADPSLVRSGPGRASNGNFALSEFQVTAQPIAETTDSKGAVTPVKLVTAKATFEQNGLPVAAAIDDNPSSAWAVDPEFGKDHAAVFATAEPFGFENGTRVTITLKYNTNVHHSIGRPRLTISQKSDLPATTGGALDETIQKLIDTPFDQLAAAQKMQVLNWYKSRDPGWKSLNERRAAHAAIAPKPRVQKVLVATEGLPPVTLHTQAEAEFLKETHFLRRGEPNNKESVATQSFLQVLMANPDAPQLFQVEPPPGWRTSYRRTAFTNWLVDRESGAGNLLARVAVNRLWQHHLGRGIVATPSDFGTRGELPTHPKLLDWLAVELVRHRWELKPLHRAILSSATYRQSCDVNEMRLAVDRENRLLWHRPRRRLEAEIIRDATLAISGQLDDRLYGPGRLDEGHQRRSLYFTVKRSQLMPSMTVFDAPDGTTPVADRPETTIAPQALLLMNNPQVRGASRQFAARLLAASLKSPEEAVKLGYLMAVGRAPNEDELAGSVKFLRQQSDSYAGADPKFKLSRALEDFCQILFCLNEFIYVE